MAWSPYHLLPNCPTAKKRGGHIGHFSRGLFALTLIIGFGFVRSDAGEPPPTVPPQVDEDDLGLFLAAAPPPNPEIDVLINRASEFSEGKRFEVSIALLQKVIDTGGGTMTTRDGRRFVTARALAEEMLRDLPPQGQRLYHLTADPQAQFFMQVWQTKRDPRALREIVNRFFLSEAGDDAALLLGSYYLDRYEFHKAGVLFQKILDHYPAPTVSLTETLTRLAFVRSRQQDSAGAAALWLRAVEVDPEEDRLTAMTRIKKSIDNPPLNDLPTERNQGWQTTLGNASRNGIMPAFPELQADTRGQKTLVQYWAQPLINNVPPASARPDQFRGRRGIPLARARQTGSPAELARRWKTGGWMPTAQLVFQDGRVYCSALPQLMCFDADSGQRIWSSATPSSPPQNQRRLAYNKRTRAAQNDNSMFQNRLSRVMSIVGKMIYRIENETSTPTTRFGFGYRRGQAQGNSLVAFERETGKRLWRISSTTDDSGTLLSQRFMAAPVRIGACIIVPTEGSTGVDKGLSLIALDPDTGSVHWKKFLCTYTTTGSLSPVGVTAEGSDVYIVTGEGLVMNVDGISGETLWAAKYRRLPNPTRRNRFRRGNAQPPSTRKVGTRWLDNVAFIQGATLVVLATDLDRLLIFDRATGHLLQDMPNKAYTYPLGIRAGGLFVAGKTGAAKIDLTTLTLSWQTTTEPLFGRGILTAKSIFLSAADAVLALDPKSGKLSGTIPAFRPAATPLGNLYTDGNRLLLAGATELRALMNPVMKMTSLDAAVAKNPSAENFASRGQFLFTMKRMDAALPDLRRAHQLNQNNRQRAKVAADLVRTETRLTELSRALLHGQPAGGSVWTADFSRPNNTREWEASDGVVSIENNVLTLSPTPVVRGKPFTGQRENQVAWLKGKTFRGSFQMQFTGWQTDANLCDLNAQFRFPRKDGKGGKHYIYVKFGAYGNTTNVLGVDKQRITESSHYRITKGKKHKIIVTRIADRIVMAVDGKRILDGEVHALKDYTGEIEIALYGWGAPHYFSNLKVVPLPNSFLAAMKELTTARQALKNLDSRLAQVGTISLAELRQSLITCLLAKAGTANENARPLLDEALTLALPGDQAERIRYLRTLHSMQYGTPEEVVAAFPDLRQPPSGLVQTGAILNTGEQLRSGTAQVYASLLRGVRKRKDQTAFNALTEAAEKNIAAEGAKEKPDISTLQQYLMVYLDEPLGLTAGLVAATALRKAGDTARAEAFYHLLAKSKRRETAVQGRVKIALMYTERDWGKLAHGAWGKAVKYFATEKLSLPKYQNVALTVAELAEREQAKFATAKNQNKPLSAPRLLWKSLPRRSTMGYYSYRQGLQDPTFQHPYKIIYSYPATGASAMDVATGKTVWRIELKPQNGSRRSYQPPVLGRDLHATLLSLNQRLSAVDTRTGRKLWDWDTTGQILNGSHYIKLAGGQAFVTTRRGANGTLTAIDAATGHVEWELTLPGKQWQGESRIPVGRYIVVKSTRRASHTVTILDALTGTRAGQFANELPIIGYGDDGILISGSGTVGWRKFPDGKWVWRNKFANNSRRAFNLGNNLLLLATPQGTNIHEARSGNLIAKCNVNLPRNANAVYNYSTNEVIFLRYDNSRQHLQIVDAKTGKQRSRLTLPANTYWDARLGMTRDHIIVRVQMPQAEFMKLMRNRNANRKKTVIRMRYALVRKNDGKIEPRSQMPTDQDVASLAGYISIQATRYDDKLMLSYGNRAVWVYQLPGANSAKASGGK